MKVLENMDDLGDLARKVPIGVYEHYKGERYYVFGIGRDHNSKARGPVVIYTRLYRLDGIPMSVRSVSDFLSEVSCDGNVMRRFKYLGLSDASPSECQKHSV